MLSHQCVFLQENFKVTLLHIIIVLDYCLRSVTEGRLEKSSSGADAGIITYPRRSRMYLARMLNDLDFADDIALLESSLPRAQAQLTRIATAAADLELSSVHLRQNI
jgi:hypothetical protein